MKLLNKSPEFFEKYKEKPKKLFVYGPKIQALSDKYLEKVKKLVGEFGKVEPIGSVVYKIPAGDVEVAVYPKEGKFAEVVKILEREFGKPETERDDFVKFEIEVGEIEVSINVYQGYEALFCRNFTKYMLDHPKLIEEYQKIKQEFSYSKREYQKQKYKFYDRILPEIPDNYA